MSPGATPELLRAAGDGAFFQKSCAVSVASVRRRRARSPKKRNPLATAARVNPMRRFHFSCEHQCRNSGIAGEHENLSSGTSWGFDDPSRTEPDYGRCGRQFGRGGDKHPCESLARRSCRIRTGILGPRPNRDNSQIGKFLSSPSNLPFPPNSLIPQRKQFAK